MSICLFFIAHRRLKKNSPRINLEDSSLLGCSVLWGEWFLTFQRSIIPLFSRDEVDQGYQNELTTDNLIWHWKHSVSWKVGAHSLNYAASHPRSLEFLVTLLWKPQNLHGIRNWSEIQTTSISCCDISINTGKNCNRTSTDTWTLQLWNVSVCV